MWIAKENFIYLSEYVLAMKRHTVAMSSFVNKTRKEIEGWTWASDGERTEENTDT